MASEQGIINGVGNNRFNPEGLLPYGEALKLASEIHANYHGNVIEEPSTKGHWSNKYVQYATKNKIITERKSIGLDSYITRGQMFIYFANSLPETEFPIVNEVPHYYKDYSTASERLYYGGVVLGNGESFESDKNITRAETSAIVCRIIDKSLRKTSVRDDIEYIQEPAKKALKVINNERKKLGLEEIIIDLTLTKGVVSYDNNVTNNRWNGMPLKDLEYHMKMRNVEYTYLREIRGVTTCMTIDEVINSFITTPELYETITDPNIKKMGFIACGFSIDIGELSWTVLFTD